MTSTHRVTNLISELAIGNTGDASNIDPPRETAILNIDELR